jgi:hypothetical protein
MTDDTKNRILDAFLVVLRPIARLLLRFGIGFREFSEISKVAFVDVASSEYGLRGRPTNISRVAVMTGLTRKEVRRVREKISSGQNHVEVKSTPLSEILHRWHSESDFLDSSGRPRVLRFSGEGSSFSNLVKKFGGDIPPGAMRTELKRVGAVTETDSGDLKAISRVVLPAGEQNNVITSLVHAVYPLLSTIAHNTDPDRDDSGWAQINAFSQSIRKSDMPRLRRISYDRLKDVSESFDDLFMAYESLHENDDQENDNNVVSVGVFYFEEHDGVASKVW